MYLIYIYNQCQSFLTRVMRISVQPTWHESPQSIHNYISPARPTTPTPTSAQQGQQHRPLHQPSKANNTDPYISPARPTTPTPTSAQQGQQHRPLHSNHKPKLHDKYNIPALPPIHKFHQKCSKTQWLSNAPRDGLAWSVNQWKGKWCVWNDWFGTCPLPHLVQTSWRNKAF